MKMKNLCVSWVLSDTRNICPFQGTGRGALGIVGVVCGASQHVHVKEKLSSHQFKRGGSETWVREMNSSHTARRTEAILWITEVPAQPVFLATGSVIRGQQGSQRVSGKFWKKIVHVFQVSFMFIVL